MAKQALFDRIREHIRNKSAERLKEWKSHPEYNEEIVNNAFNKLDEDMSKMNPHMAITEDALKKVLKSGKFKNQFQTNTSGGSFNFSKRAKHSNNHFGTPITKVGEDEWGRDAFEISKALKDSEKYGYLNGDASQYGNYVVDFKPSVKNRMTAHIGDSLGMDEYSFIPGERDTYYGMLAHNGRFNYSTRDEYMDNLANGVPLSERGEYLEAQFHGPLTTGDINSIKINRDKVNPKVREYSTANYIPLYDEKGCYNACYDVTGKPIWIPED